MPENWHLAILGMTDFVHVDVGLTVAANVGALKKAMALRAQKFAQLEREREVAARKQFQSSRLIKSKGCKKARQKTNMQVYNFQHSRNPKNGAALPMIESFSMNQHSNNPKGDCSDNMCDVLVAVDAALKNLEASLVLVRSTPGTMLVSSDDSLAKDLGIVSKFQISFECK